MTEKERQILEDYRTAVETEMIKRALVASQRLCEAIQSGNPNAIETAKDVEKRLEIILQGRRLRQNEVNLNSHTVTTLQ